MKPDPAEDVQLAGTSGGNLFGLFLYDERTGDYPQHLAQIDVTTGKLLSWVDLRSVFTASFAFGTFAAWGTDLYFFDNYGTVTRYTPATGEATVVATLPGANSIVAAASSCALN